MATVVLQTVGAVAGGALLGPVGAAIGSAAGALLGYAIDKALIDSTRHDVGPRLTGPRPFNAEEGAPLPRIYGTARVGGLLIWATRFEEEARTERQGAKGGPRSTTYSYYANVAFALCEGPISGVRRVWADGRELDLTQVEMRVRRGRESAQSDPLIEAKQGNGNAPAYRGTAYVVFERFPIGDYGNRIPQFQFEVMRPVGALNGRIRAVALLPGSTEYGLSPEPVTREISPGESVFENRHVLHGATDLVASLDELQALCPNIERVAVVVTWFGDDLRAGECRIRPMVTDDSVAGLSRSWRVSGISRGNAAVVSRHGGSAAYGGTPSDRSVLEAIAEIRSRGLGVTLYPFVMMDIPSGNDLPDPNTGASTTPPYPWRGRITCAPGPGRPGSADKTSAARSQIDGFCGAATAGDFTASGNTVDFGGSAGDFGYRRLVLHYARLAAMAGGVDAFLIGSELRGLTTLRDNAGKFPFVEQLCDLASEARGILGSGCKITYGADWTEYFGHQPADGSGDVLFQLDALWAHDDIDAVGIDNYMPLADWREGDAFGMSPDGATGPYDIAAMRRAVTGGEGFDWYYASSGNRANRVRTAIGDGAYGKPWVFRYKDLLGWWSNAHHNRPGGVQSSSATAWVPRSKPIWFTELGSPAVDKGANQPNVFPDAKSSESARPYFSSGTRADQAVFSLGQAQLDRWDGESGDFVSAENPVSPLYGGRMVDRSRIYFWAWDARPFPAFPNRSDVWGDGRNWLRGHWLNGRIEGSPVADVIDRILRDHGLPAADTSRVSGTVTGYVLPDPSTARGALEPLLDLYGISARESANGLVFAGEAAVDGEPVLLDELVVPDGEAATVTRIREAEPDLPSEVVLQFHDAMREYQSATARSMVTSGRAGGIHRLPFSGVLDPGLAAALVEDWLKRKTAAREQARFVLDHSRVDVEPGALVRLPEGNVSGAFQVVEMESGAGRSIAARRLASARPAEWEPDLGETRPIRATRAGPPLAHLLDLPMLPGAAATHQQLRVAVRARPWVAHAVFASPAADGYAQRATVQHEATVGRLAGPLAPGFEGRMDKAGSMTVDLLHGALESVPDIQLLAGANRAAVQSLDGDWEVLQFGAAEEIEPSRWRLSRLLRGQAGTRLSMLAGAADAADFVLLDAAVVPAGLAAGEVGLLLNWRVGPVGYEFGGPVFATISARGGTRAGRPLPPAHLRVRRMEGGSFAFDWKRRGRVDADRGLSSEVPLGEEVERYQIQLLRDGTPVRTATSAEPYWAYPAELAAEDFPLPATATAIVRQISVAAGAGDAATATFPVL